MVVIGGYVGWWALTSHGFNPIVALVIAFIVAFIAGTGSELISVSR